MWRLDVYERDKLPLPLPGRRLNREEHYRWRWLAVLNAWLWEVLMANPYTIIETEVHHYDADGRDSTTFAA